jgi:CRP-like cAMP-binding protein
MAYEQAIVEALKRVPFLSKLNDEERDTLASVLKTNRLETGKVLFQEGQQGDSLHILVVGQLQISVAGHDGSPKTIATIQPGDVVGEMSCVDPGLRSASVVAIRRSIALELDRMTLQAMLAHMPRLAVAVTTGVINALTERIRNTNQRIMDELDARGMAGASSPTEAPPAAQSAVASQNPSGKVNLREVSCLKPFTDAQLETLLRIAPPKTYRGGTMLCREGAIGDGCFIIVRGAVEVLRQINGKSRVLATLRSGSMVGQMALVDAAPRSASVRTAEDSIILPLQRDAFTQLLQSADSLAIRFQEQIAIAGIRQLRLANLRLKTLIKTPARRIEKKSPRPAKQAAAPRAKVRTSAHMLPKPSAPNQAAVERNARQANNRTARLHASTGPSPFDAAALEKQQRIKAGTGPNPSDMAALEREQRIKAGSGPIHPALMQNQSFGQTEEERYERMLTFMQTALDDWDMDMGQLDDVSVSRASGEMSATEKQLRQKK